MSDAPPPGPLSSAPPGASPFVSLASPRYAWALPLLIALAYLIFYQVVLRLPGSVGAQITSTLISLGLLVWLAAQFARTIRAPGALLLHLLAALLLFVLFAVLLSRENRLWLDGHIPGLRDLVFIWFAASLGGLLSFIVRSANLIPPIAAILALVDIWTVLLGGPVGKIMQSSHPTARAVRQVMTVQLAAPKVGAAPIPVAGFADFLFIAFFVASISRFVPDPAVYRRMIIALTGILCAYMLLVFASGWNLPALLPMAVVMIGLHWRYFHYDRSELFALLYAALFIALIAAGFWYFGRHNAPLPAPEHASAQPVSTPRARYSSG